MKRRKLEKSDVEISVVTFGAWAIGGWMWGGADSKSAVDAIHACFDHDITTIDTAPIYGFGKSEEIVGKAVRGNRDRYEILTKYGMHWDGNKKGEYFFNTADDKGNPLEIYKYSGKESIIKECELSLKRLGTDYIDLYQIHWPDSTTPVEETMEAVFKLMEQGKVKAAGVCNYSVDLLERAKNVLELSTNQVPYSMVRREIEKEVVPWCIKNNCGILAYSPLQRGLLSGKITPDYVFNPGDSRPDTPHFKKNNIISTNRFLDEIRPVAEEKGITLSQLAVRWTLQQPGITAALVGARDPQQVAENAVAMNIEISENEMAVINHALDRLTLDL